jgi:L-2,4-diaminobutyric acid acetyltransferase
MRAEAWQALGQMFAIAGGLVAVFWAAYNYRKNTRVVAARWMKELHAEFYTEPELLRGRELLEYDYETELRYLFEIRVTDRQLVLNDRLRGNLRMADRVLNFFEQITYLEEESHIRASDRKVFFEYWYGLLSDPRKSGLRRYLARCGYERCTSALKIHRDDYIVFYGTLMRGYDSLRQLGAENMVQYVGPCRVPGQLVDLGEWPGLVAGQGSAKAELWKILDYEVFRLLDPFERYDPATPSGSHYERRTVRLVEPERVDAWVYYLREPGPAAPAIEADGWNAYVEARNNMTAEIRVSEPGDAGALYHLAARLAPLTVHTPYTYWVLCTYGVGHCFLAIKDSEPVGFVTGFLSSAQPYVMLVWQVGVVPELRGTGLADRLLDRLAEAARAEGAVRIDATIAEKNSSAKAAFERLAKRVDSRLRPIEHVNFDAGQGTPPSVEMRFEIDITPFPRIGTPQSAVRGS